MPKQDIPEKKRGKKAAYVYQIGSAKPPQNSQN